MSDAKAVSDFWAVNRRGNRVGWAEHPSVRDFMHRRVSGDPKLSTYLYWVKKYFQTPAPLALSLGCGFGGFERDWVRVGAVEHFHALDLSEGALQKARELAAEAGYGDKIDYRVADLNNIKLPAQTYDAIFAIMSAHHVYGIENYFRECRKALKPGAYMFLDEYIGPNRIQCSPFIVSIINRIRDILPEKYRRHVLHEGKVVGQYRNTPIEHFERFDPSEAIRSAELVSTISMYFDIVEIRPYGGQIQHMLLSGIAGNFDENDPTDVALLNMFGLLEEVLEERGVVASDFAAIVAKAK